VDVGGLNLIIFFHYITNFFDKTKTR
jgi:hypothetical protein